MKRLETQQEILKKTKERGYKQRKSQIRRVFEAGVEFVYKKYPFLEDTVSERMKNDDYGGFSEVVSVDKDTGCPKWDEGKWGYEIDKAVAELIRKLQAQESETETNLKERDIETENIKETKRATDRIFLSQKQRDLTFEVKRLESFQPRRNRKLSKAKKELAETIQQLEIINDPELNKVKETKKDCECDCEACFSCEHRPSGVIIEGGED